MNTKTDGISSGLVAVAWSYASPLGTVRKLQERKPVLNNPEEHHWTPLVRLSDAEAIISQQADRINELTVDIAEEEHIRDRMSQLLAETAVAIKGPEKALHHHGWQDLPEVAAKQSAALKLARYALAMPCDRWNKRQLEIVNEALAAISAAMQEDKP